MQSNSHNQVNQTSGSPSLPKSLVPLVTHSIFQTLHQTVDVCIFFVFLSVRVGSTHTHTCTHTSHTLWRAKRRDGVVEPRRQIRSRFQSFTRSTNLFARENIKVVYVKSRRETHTERGGVDRRAAWPLPEGRMVQNSGSRQKRRGWELCALCPQGVFSSASASSSKQQPLECERTPRHRCVFSHWKSGGG